MHFFLLFLLMMSERSECLTMGKEFIAVFPENVAYYHPTPPVNVVRFIALNDGTQVTTTFTITQADGASYSQMNVNHLQSGFFQEVYVDAGLELDKTDISEKVLTITSNHEIAVQILSQRLPSIQTALLLPTDQLGTEYIVPPIPQIPGTWQVSETETTEKSPFKLIIVNNKESNTITLDGAGGGSIVLEPGQVLQHWVYQDMVGTLVTGTAPFLALFGHSCAVQYDCTCGMLYSPLQPHSSNTFNFIIPSVFSDGAEDQTFILKPSVHELVQFTTTLDGNVQMSGPLMLYRPGLLMHLIPEADFGSCFAILTVSSATNWAVILAPAATTEDVMIGTTPVVSDWTSVSGTDFKYTKFKLVSWNNIIWNKSGLMAVWFLGETATNVWFGNPAPCLTKDPDRRGCVLEMERFEVLHEEGTWQEAIQACRNRSMTLISFSDETFQNSIYSWLLDQGLNGMELWIGLRKSSYSSKWYWMSEEPLKHEDWSEGSPGGPDDGQCGRVNLKDSNNPGWVHRDCCSMAKAVCHQPPALLRM